MPEDPTEVIKAPHIEKKAPEILTTQEVAELLDSPRKDTPKGCRDKAMMELLYATGVRGDRVDQLSDGRSESEYELHYLQG